MRRCVARLAINFCFCVSYRARKYTPLPVSILGFENCQSFFSYNCPCTYGVPQCAVHRNHRLIQRPVHPSFGLVKCTAGRVYPSNSASWTGNNPSKVITRPRCTEYDRASISFRLYCANSARRKSAHAQVSSRVIGQAVLRSELRCAAATHWSRHGQSMERGVKLQTKTAAYYYR